MPEPALHVARLTSLELMSRIDAPEAMRASLDRLGAERGLPVTTFVERFEEIVHRLGIAAEPIAAWLDETFGQACWAAFNLGFVVFSTSAFAGIAAEKPEFRQVVSVGIAMARELSAKLGLGDSSLDDAIANVETVRDDPALAAAAIMLGATLQSTLLELGGAHLLPLAQNALSRMAAYA